MRAWRSAAGSATGMRPAPTAATALRFFEPITPPSPPRAAAFFLPVITAASRARCSPAGPMTADTVPGPWRARSAPRPSSPGRPRPRAVAPPQRLLDFVHWQPPQPVGREQPPSTVFEEQIGRRGCLPLDDQAVEARLAHRRGEEAPAVGVAQPERLGRLGRDVEAGGVGGDRAREGPGADDEGGLRPERG